MVWYPGDSLSPNIKLPSLINWSSMWGIFCGANFPWEGKLVLACKFMISTSPNFLSGKLAWNLVLFSISLRTNSRPLRIKSKTFTKFCEEKKSIYLYLWERERSRFSHLLSSLCWMFCEKTSALWPPIFYAYDKVLARICSEVLIDLRTRRILIIYTNHLGCKSFA